MKTPGKHDIDILRRILDKGVRSKLLHGPEAEPFFTDWTGQYKSPHGGIVLFPDSADQISQILSHCSAESIAVVPQGGLTGLVGGGVPRSPAELIMNLSKMDRILNINQQEGIGSFEAGVILQNADSALRRQGLMAPVDLGAKGSCQLGGLVACNAGGTRFRRYGSMHANVAGMDVVLADGMVLKLSNQMRKNNCGLDLKHLFIGSEGTLGIISSIDLFCPISNRYSMVSMISVNNFTAVAEIYALAQTSLEHQLAAFEFWDSNCEELVDRHLSKSVRKTPSTFSILVEGHSEDFDMLDSIFTNFLEKLSDSRMIQDAIVATDGQQAENIWGVRENISEACSREAVSRGGIVCKYDISLPINRMYDIVNIVNNKYKKSTIAIGFGHVGDGNLHLNIISNPQLKPELDRLVYDYVYSVRGSISAEHGIGQLKLAEFMRSVEPSKLFVSQLIKQQLDPHGILNPGKLFHEQAKTNQTIIINNK